MITFSLLRASDDTESLSVEAHDTAKTYKEHSMYVALNINDQTIALCNTHAKDYFVGMLLKLQASDTISLEEQVFNFVQLKKSTVQRNSIKILPNGEDSASRIATLIAGNQSNLGSYKGKLASAILSLAERREIDLILSFDTADRRNASTTLLQEYVPLESIKIVKRTPPSLMTGLKNIIWSKTMQENWREIFLGSSCVSAILIFVVQVDPKMLLCVLGGINGLLLGGRYCLG